MVGVGGTCSICHTHYRSWAEHAGSESHRAKAYRYNNPASRSRKGHKRIARDEAWRRARRRQRDDDKIRVRAHRRRPPDDGQQKRVRVVKHWRGEPYAPTTIHRLDKRGRHYEERYSAAGHLLRRRWLKK